MESLCLDPVPSSSRAFHASSGILVITGLDLTSSTTVLLGISYTCTRHRPNDANDYSSCLEPFTNLICFWLICCWLNRHELYKQLRHNSVIDDVIGDDVYPGTAAESSLISAPYFGAMQCRLLDVIFFHYKLVNIAFTNHVLFDFMQ